MANVSVVCKRSGRLCTNILIGWCEVYPSHVTGRLQAVAFHLPPAKRVSVWLNKTLFNALSQWIIGHWALFYSPKLRRCFSLPFLFIPSCLLPSNAAIFQPSPHPSFASTQHHYFHFISISQQYSSTLLLQLNSHYYFFEFWFHSFNFHLTCRPSMPSWPNCSNF